MQSNQTQKKQPTRQDGRILCADCRHHMTGTDPCGAWWGGKPHHCTTFERKGFSLDPRPPDACTCPTPKIGDTNSAGTCPHCRAWAKKL